MVILSVVYLIGSFLAFCMLRVEHEAEKKPYTKGTRALTIALSLFSWGMVLFLPVYAWIEKINAKGYWNQPVKIITEKPESK